MAQTAPQRELTLRSIVIGGILTFLFTAANVYFGLKVGLTFSTAIPAAVVSMAGYNSVCELLTAGCRTLLVPRTTPRAEQLLRARSLQRLGWVDVLTPDLADPQRIACWTAAAVGTRPPGACPVDLDGLGRVPGLAASLLAGAARERGLADVAV